MTTVRTHSRVACFVGAMALLFQLAPVMAGSPNDPNRPVEVSLTKWVTTYPLMEGFWGRHRQYIRRRDSSTTGEREPGPEQYRSARGDL